MTKLPASLLDSLACAEVAAAAFDENLGKSSFMEMNCDALIAFRERNGLSADVMNSAWKTWQREYLDALK